jgi:hypothetical protein
LPCRFKLYHYSLLFITQRIDRIRQSGPQGLVAN